MGIKTMKYYIAKVKDERQGTWTLQDIDTGEIVQATTDEIKTYMGKKSVNVINLQLSSDNKLIPQGRFKFNISSVEGLQNASQALKDLGCVPCTIQQQNLFETSMDILIKEIIEMANCEVFQGRVLDNEKNLFAISLKIRDFALRKDEWLTLLVRYEKILYCALDRPNNDTWIFGDIAFGIRAIRFPNGKVVNYETGIKTLAESTYFFNDNVSKRNEDSNITVSNELFIVKKVNYQFLQKPALTIIDNRANRNNNMGHLFKLDSEEECELLFSGLFTGLSKLLIDSVRSSATSDDCKAAMAMYINNVANNDNIMYAAAESETKEKLVSLKNDAVEMMGNVADYANPIVRWAVTAGLLVGGVMLLKNAEWYKYYNVEEGHNVWAPGNVPIALGGIGTVATGIASGINAIVKGKTTLGWHDIEDTLNNVFFILALLKDNNSVARDGSPRHARAEYKQQVRYRANPNHYSMSSRLGETRSSK